MITYIPMIDHARLVSVLDFDPDTGVFKWKYFNRKMRAGSVAGTTRDGYGAVWVDGKQYAAHRLAWFYVHKEWLPSHVLIDHINRIPSDNRIVNLRLANKWQNSANSKQRKSASGIRGVYYSKRQKFNPWQTYINHGGKRTNLGHFATKEEAIAARSAAERILHNEFRPINLCEAAEAS